MPRACASYAAMVNPTMPWTPGLTRLQAQAQRGAARLDEHGRLDARVVAREPNWRRALGIAFEAARLVTLPTRDSPRTYIRKGVRYSVFGEDGVIWVVQVVDAPAPSDAATAPADARAPG